MTPYHEAESVLVIDVGSISTRAVLFDIVEGQYRFIAKGSANTTAGAPFRNVGEGVRLALDSLQRITGRTFLDASQRLIIPSQNDGTGVDRFASTISVGEPLRVAILGLQKDISIESACRLAQTTFSEIVQIISLNDHKKTDQRLNHLIAAHPDLVIVAGGTEGGATQSLLTLMESIGLACYLLPQGNRPEIFYAGNSAIKEEIKIRLERYTNVVFAPNIRPALELEQLAAASAQLGKLATKLRTKKHPGLEELLAWSGEGFGLTSTAFGRVIHCLSALLNGNKGVLGVDIGSNSVTVAAAIADKLSLNVIPHIGNNAAKPKTLDRADLDGILRWVMNDSTADEIQDYILNKCLHPTTLPVTLHEIEIEQAIARHALFRAISKARPGFPKELSSSGSDYLPFFEPVLAAGSLFTQAPNPAQSALLLLDGVQPVGVTTLVLDQNQIASAVGAAAIYCPLLAVQVMNSNSFLNLGTVIAPLSECKIDQPVVRLKMRFDNTAETTVDIKQGTLQTLPIPFGQTVRINIQPFHKADVGMGSSGRGGNITVKGGVLGVIIDARGRPVIYPRDRSKRQEIRRKWLWNLGDKTG